MIVQEFTLDKYDWAVTVCYVRDTYNWDFIRESLENLGCDELGIQRIFSELSESGFNTGRTFSNIESRKCLIIIGPTSSAAEFQDTFDHEKGHLAMHICLAEEIDPFSEEFQYLNGSIGHQMFKAAREFLCDHCRKNPNKILYR